MQCKTNKPAKKEKTVQPKANIVGETYDYIMNKKKKAHDDFLDSEIQQFIELINPDPNSMDSRG